MRSGRRLIRVSSAALGERETVRVYVYDDVADLRVAAARFAGEPAAEFPDTVGVCQAYTYAEDRRTHAVLIRLARGYLGSQVLSHEVHHAATALYGAHVGDRVSRRAHLNHFNEPFAHLYSDLFASLVRCLDRHGYYHDREG